MAAGILPAPGTEYGPCKDGCQHRDCAQTREMAASECVHCDEPIGFDNRFYRVDRIKDGPASHHDVYAHARCEEEA